MTRQDEWKTATITTGTTATTGTGTSTSEEKKPRPHTKKIDSQSTSDTSHAPDMDSPIIPEHQIRSKNCIKSSLSAPQLDDINVSVTKTFHSIQIMGGLALL